MENEKNYLEYLAELYPTIEKAATEIINLQSVINLPKGTEHFLSDIHGEYEAFSHVLRNGSGAVRKKIDDVFGHTLGISEKRALATLIYYPRERLEMEKKQQEDIDDWYKVMLYRLIDVCKIVSSKYTRAKVRKALPADYGYIIEELITEKPEVLDKEAYYEAIIQTILEIGSAENFIIAVAELIQRLVVDHLHIIGDIFDRGPEPYKIMDCLMNYHSLDIQWGNHDVLWMGAALGSEACIATVVRNSLRYQNTDVLERGYGISLRPLTTFASHIYPDEAPLKAAERAITIMMFKLEGQLIARNPDFQMESRRLLHQIDFRSSYARLGDGRRYELESAYFPTIDESCTEADVYELTDKEQEIIEDLRPYFTESAVLRRHVDYLYQKGNLYTCCNGNLLFHGCVPLNEDGTFRTIRFEGKEYRGRGWFDFCEQRAREAWLHGTPRALDFMYFLWCGRLSPTSGREFKTFERALIADESTWKEPSDPYYRYIDTVDCCERVLQEFGLDPKRGHIINGHVPVKVRKGESPVKAGGRAIIIDGGFCRAYHKKTGISGYTLISNSRGLRLLEHQRIADVREALRANHDIESVSETIELQSCHNTVGDTDQGRVIQDEITDLYNLLLAYQNGLLKPQA